MSKKFKLKSKYSPTGDQPKAIKHLWKGYQSGAEKMTLLGVTGSGKTYTAASLIEKINKPTLVISPNKILAAQLYREYKNYFPDNKVAFFVSYYDYYQPEAYLPTTDTYIQKEASINEEIERFRHETTEALSTRNDVIVVASVSCIYNLGVPTDYFDQAIYLNIGDIITRSDLINQLVKLQYKRNNFQLERGTFRARGDVIEVVPPSESIAYRIELVDQKISSLKVVNKTTRSIKKDLDQLVIFPAKHFVRKEEDINKAAKTIRQELDERLKYFKDNNKYLAAERLERVTKNDIAMIKSVGYCNGIENYSRHLTGQLPGQPPETLLSYFPKDKNGDPDFLTIIDESHIAVPQIKGMYRGDQARKKTLIDHGWRLPSAIDNRPLNFEEFDKRVGQVIYTSATPSDYERKHSDLITEQIIRPTYLVDPKVTIEKVFNKKSGESQIDHLEKEIAEIIKSGERVLVNALTKKMAEELANYFNENDIKSKFMHSDTGTVERSEILTEFRKGKFNVLVGVNLLREGLDLPEVSLVAILEADQEGFLRSETSFIQTMGRAARNIKGRVILYANKVTGSMRRAIDEVERRRKIQLEYNRKHDKKPKTIKKEIKPLIDLEELTNKGDK
jgi:excinuclease ABC subunit B